MVGPNFESAPIFQGRLSKELLHLQTSTQDRRTAHTNSVWKRCVTGSTGLHQMLPMAQPCPEPTKHNVICIAPLAGNHKQGLMPVVQFRLWIRCGFPPSVPVSANFSRTLHNLELTRATVSAQRFDDQDEIAARFSQECGGRCCLIATSWDGLVFLCFASGDMSVGHTQGLVAVESGCFRPVPGALCRSQARDSSSTVGYVRICTPYLLCAHVPASGPSNVQ